MGLMNFQDADGRAKEYQVKQVLAVIENLLAEGADREESADAEV